jgi:branched-chain amino acid transport system substrate-binding protein
MSMLRRLAILALVALVPLVAGCSSDVNIGAVISESGAVATYGERVKKGMDLAVEEINAAGGFKGGSFHLIYKDDATNSGRGRQVVQELIEQEGVKIVIGAVSSPVTLSIAPICQDKRIVLLSPSSSAPNITEAGDYIFRNYPSDVLEGTAMARFARDLGLERVVIFAVDNEFGAGLRDVFTDQYTSKYREVIKVFNFKEGQTEDFPAMVEEVRQLEPDGIYILAYLDSFAQLLKLVHGADLGAVLMGGSSVVAEDLVAMSGEATESLVFSRSVFDVESRDPAVASFVAAYRERWGEAPDHYAAHGYDAVKLILKAMETGGSAHPDDVKIGLLGLKQHQGAAGPTQFDENGDVVRYPRMFIIKQGRTMPYEKFVEEGGSLFPNS